MLLCAPSMGILDNWLPVLHAARAAHPDWRIVALIPDRDTLVQLDATDTAHVLADEVIDTTVAPLVGGGWIETPGLLAALDAAAPRRVLPRLRTREQRRRRTRPEWLAGPDSRLLYDVHLHEKTRVASLLEAMGDTPRFSHNHGIELEVPDAGRTPPRDPHNVRAAFVYGPSEVEAYARNFRLPHEAVHVVGIVRHEPEWVARVVARSEVLHDLPFEEFAFVVSRPAGSSYLPHDRKIAALRALHRVMWEEHGLPLVLRTHPKEHEDGTLALGLPGDGEGVSWARSRAHPFHLATRSRIGVTFLSGVAVDLVALGVPVIELLDVRGLPEHDREDALRDEHGRILFGPYRRDGLVLPADDEVELRETVAHVLSGQTAETDHLMRRVRSRTMDSAPRAARMLPLIAIGVQERP